MLSKKTIIASFLVISLSGCGMDVGNSDNDNFEIGNDNRVDNSVRYGGEEDSEAKGVGGRDARDGINPDCSAGVISGSDGALGFLWKPISESDGRLVVLFPESYDVRFESVEAEVVGGGLESGEFGGFTNGSRQTWRFDQEGGAYTGLLKVQDEAQDCLWEVETPGQRVD